MWEQNMWGKRLKGLPPVRQLAQPVVIRRQVLGCGLEATEQIRQLSSIMIHDVIGATPRWTRTRRSRGFLAFRGDRTN